MEALLRTQVDFFDDGSLRMIANNIETHVAQRAFRQVLESLLALAPLGRLMLFEKRRDCASAGLF